MKSEVEFGELTHITKMARLEFCSRFRDCLHPITSEENSAVRSGELRERNFTQNLEERPEY